MGYIINKEGLLKDPEKVAAMIEAKRPESITEIRAFTGLVTFYGKFVPRLTEILKPIYEVQNKDKFKWTKEAEKAFKEVKEKLAADRNLVHYNPNYPIKLVTDASDQGIAAVLLHLMPDGEERPITYISRTLSKAETNYAVLHKEALAIYWAIRKLYQYLARTQFKQCTDHRPLLTIIGEHKGIPQMAAGRLQRWALFLSGFDYRIEQERQEKLASKCIITLTESQARNDTRRRRLFTFHGRRPVTIKNRRHSKRNKERSNFE